MEPRNYLTLFFFELKRVLFLFVFALFSLSHSLFSVVNIEISELVRLFAGGNDAQPITELLFLQVLLDQVFKISLRKGGLGKNGDFSLLALELDRFTKSSSLSVNLDVLGEEGFLYIIVNNYYCTPTISLR